MHKSPLQLSGPATINIPFRILLEMGENKFKLRVPRRYLDSEMEYKFGFAFMTLIPEYYSQQALKHNLDPIDEGERDVEYPFDVEFVFADNYLPIGQQYVQTTDEIELPKLVKQINAHFSRLKPTGSTYPPMVVDWYRDGWEESGMSFKTFHESTKAAYYKDTYDPAVHDNALPTSAKGLTMLNNLAFPDTTEEEVLKTIRVRLSIAPNTRIAFSNEHILKSLGFTEDQIPAKVNKQHNYTNILSERIISISGQQGVKTVTTEGKNSKITPYLASRTQPARNHIIKTSRKRELDPDELAKDVSAVIEIISKECNQAFGISFNKQGNKFVFEYPTHIATKVVMHMPPRLSKLLGFQPVDTISSPTQPEALSPLVESSESEHQGRTLVFDIGMASVNLEDYFSDSTSNFSSMSMATLEANYSGTMSTRANHSMPSVHVTYFKPDLEFSLFRFNEKGLPAPLGLPCAAYLQGVLCGKSINSEGMPRRQY
jgi:hypothetical protein